MPAPGHASLPHEPHHVRNSSRIRRSDDSDPSFIAPGRCMLNLSRSLHGTTLIRLPYLCDPDVLARYYSSVVSNEIRFTPIGKLPFSAAMMRDRIEARLALVGSRSGLRSGLYIGEFASSSSSLPIPTGSTRRREGESGCANLSVVTRSLFVERYGVASSDGGLSSTSVDDVGVSA